MAFLIFTEDTLRGQEGVVLALRQTFLWKKPEGAQGPEGIAGSSSVISLERWGGVHGRVGLPCIGDMCVVGAVMGCMESHGVLDDWYRAM